MIRQRTEDKNNQTVINVDEEAIYLSKINQSECKKQLASRILKLYSDIFPQNEKRIEMFADMVLKEVPEQGGKIPKSAIDDFYWFNNRKL